MVEYLDWNTELNETSNLIIRIQNIILDPILGETRYTENDIAGIMFYVPEAKKFEIYLGDARIEDTVVDVRDKTGKSSVSVRWNRQQFDSHAFGTNLAENLD